MGFSAQDDRRLAEWMRAAQDGDKQAYAAALREIEGALKRYLLRRLHSEESVEDVAQDILISIHSVRHTYNPEKLFGPWMYAIARNRLADYWRKHFRARAEVAVESEALDVAEPEKGDSALSDQMETALKELPEQQRSVVHMLKIQGLSIR